MNGLFSMFSKRSGRQRRRRSRLSPDWSGDIVYAIGDVHGCLDRLRALEARIVADTEPGGRKKRIVMLGDYIDRGPSSSGVLDHLMARPPEGLERVCLAGNHEDMFLDFIETPSLQSPWLHLGGLETLASYGIYIDGCSSREIAAKMRSQVPTEHIDFMRGLPVMIEYGNYCFVHAGIDPKLPTGSQSDETLLTSRPSMFDWSVYTGNCIVIHGHTPVDTLKIQAPRINIDLDVYRTGRLVALKLNNGTVIPIVTD